MTVDNESPFSNDSTIQCGVGSFGRGYMLGGKSGIFGLGVMVLACEH
jgi:hypothetical protein